MATCYKEIVAYKGCEVKDIIKFYRAHDFSFKIEEFLFAFKVFTELNIIAVKNGTLTVNGVKTSLTDSAVYNGVEELKKL